MTEFCSVLVNESWEPDTDPSIIVEYVFEDGDSDIASESVKTHTRDHLSSLSGLPQRLQVTQRRNPCDDYQHCQITLQCKPVYSVSIVGVSVASEARTLEVYDGRDGSYLQTVRGGKDKEDSEADDSRVHFLCQCHLDRPLGAVTFKFLSLGQRVSFEIAHIRVVVGAQTCPPGAESGDPGATAVTPGTVDMDRLQQEVEGMGDSVSDRAKAFLATLQNFQKNKRGAVDDLRHLLLNKNASGGKGHSMAGITTLLSMFAAASSSTSGRGPTQPTSQAHDSGGSATEGSVMNNMLTQMMSSLAVGGGEGGAGEKAHMYQFLQSVCGQVSAQRAAGEERAHGTAGDGGEQATGDKGNGDLSASSSSAELERRVASQVEAIVEGRLSAVEDHIKQQVDQRMEELETRVTGKLDAIFALLQAQKQS